MAKAQSSRFTNDVASVLVALDPETMTGDKPFLQQRLIDPDFTVLGIGEQSHGTSEFFTVRMALIGSLARSGKINRIGLEAPLCEVEHLNDYLANRTGDLRAILKSFRLFNYECQEFVDLVEQVKQINRSGKIQLTFFGIDMQSPFQSLENMRAACTPEQAATADSIQKLIGFYRQLDNELYSHNITKEDFRELAELSDRVIGTLEKNGAAAPGQDRLRKSIRNYRQFLMLNDPDGSFKVRSSLRDSLMADNALAEMQPNDRTVILAHNGHVQKTENVYSKSTGYFLSKRLGRKYKCIGLTTSSGFFTAFTPDAGRVTDQNPLPAPVKDSFEYAFSKTGKPVFFFETSKVKPDGGQPYLPAQYKLLPFGITDKPFITGNLVTDFDYVIHIEQTRGNHSFYLR